MQDSQHSRAAVQLSIHSVSHSSRVAVQLGRVIYVASARCGKHLQGLLCIKLCTMQFLLLWLSAAVMQVPVEHLLNGSNCSSTAVSMADVAPFAVSYCNSCALKPLACNGVPLMLDDRWLLSCWYAILSACMWPLSAHWPACA